MPDGKLSDHFTDDIVQVQAALHIGEQHFILRLHRRPVDAVHVFEVETVPEGAPRLIEDLGPFLMPVDVGIETLQVDAFLRGGSLAPGQVCDKGLATGSEQGLLAENGHAAVHDGGGFLLLEIEILHAAATGEPESFPVAENRTHPAGAGRDLDDAVKYAVCIYLDFDGVGLLFFLCSILPRSRLGRFGLVSLGRLSVHGQERRNTVLCQQGDVKGAHVGVGIVPFDLAVDRVEVLGRVEYQILAIRAEKRGGGIVPFLGNGNLLPGCQVVYIDHGQFVGSRPGIGEPFAVRRPAYAAELRFGAGRDDGLCPVRDADGHDAVLTVRVEQALGVRGPFQVTDISVVVAGDLGRGLLLRVVEPDLGLAGPVGDIGDPLAVRAVFGIALIGAGRVGDVALDAGLDRHGEDFAACGNGQAVTLRGEAGAGPTIGYVPML